jgi:predicted nucleic acid-binding protein
LIYADTSALAKLVTVEAETAALRTWLAGLPDERLTTNQVGIVELKRMAARLGPDVEAEAYVLAQRVDRLDVTGATYSLAEHLPPVQLRTLDALHVASAAQARDVTAFLTYDARMAEAAALAGLRVVAPA